ncbi:MAG TPA: hypothetical protein VHS08_03565, partial [Candidatus Acidoferrales bacterium]|nr:hypothetical protein [Candidatus Acidoferrales bacterium]
RACTDLEVASASRTITNWNNAQNMNATSSGKAVAHPKNITTAGTMSEDTAITDTVMITAEGTTAIRALAAICSCRGPSGRYWFK